MNIAVIGLEYVGLIIALQFARASATVIGLNIGSAKFNSLNSGRDIKNISYADISMDCC
jgi:UDP-N-acetyl-D-mannosaminuronate dehydrogenase